MEKYIALHQQSIENPEEFWKDQAANIDWFKFPEEILGKDDEGLDQWFSGGKLNTSYLAIDRHVENGRGDQLALVYDSPVTDTKESYTYSQLLEEVSLVAGMLKALEVEKGDRVVIYMPMIPQTVFAMLACARIGAIHSVVFGGFAAHELAIRINDAKPKVLLTASGGKEIDKVIAYKPLVDEALDQAEHSVSHTVVYQRPFIQADLKAGRDYDWMKLRDIATPAQYVEVDATDILYIIYTSGTTGKPKGVMRDNGGHAVAMEFSMKHIYGAQPGDVYWAASDVGWVVGHSYIVYGPLIHGCTTLLFEGKPIRTPNASTFWRIMSEYKVNVFFTAPTAFRAVIKEDPEGKFRQQYDIRNLRYLFLAGERCDVGTLKWLQDQLSIPIIDHWWQTESGWPMLANQPGIELLPVKPGSATVPVPGYAMEVFDEEGNTLPPNQEGALVIKCPLPPGTLPNLWGNTTRFKNAYFAKFPGYYDAEDSAYIDEDGYVFITGRMDDIINVAGHRLSTATIEEVISSNEAVAECAVIGVMDELKGQIPVGFVVIKDGISTSQGQLIGELIQAVRAEVGPVASFKTVFPVARLPKTRSGKILRKTMRAIADGKEYVVPSTIEDMTVLDEIKQVLFKEA